MIPALIWKLLEWIWYTFISKNGRPTVEGETAKCPISGAVETEATKCPGSTTKENKTTDEIKSEEKEGAPTESVETAPVATECAATADG